MAGTVVDEPALAAGLDRLAHQLVRCFEHRAKLLVRDLGRRAPRRNPCLPERLRLPQVADAGDEPLVEHGVPDLPPRIAPQVGDHHLELRRLGQDVGPQPADRAVVELEHGAVPEDRLALSAPQHQPRAADELRAPGANGPATGHAEVVAKHDSALEAEEKVFAGRLDGDQPLAVEPGCKLLHRRARMRRLNLEPLAHERLKTPSDSCEGVAFGHCGQASAMRLSRSLRPAAAGAAAASAWGLLERLDTRLFRCDYSDIAVLGKALTRGPGWRPVGFALHALNGAAFGLAFDALRRRVDVEPRRLAIGMALAEHVGLYPLSYFVDRYHPARGEPGVPPLLTNGRAFGQATARHLLFGIVLGRLAA